jgi:DNA repair protein RecO (recombination protein O)
MSERIDNERAYVLHAYPYRETSLIVEVMSRHYGRLALVARGARRAQSGLRARLLAFQPLALSWFGKGAMKTLHAVEWLGGSLRLEGHALMCGFYVNELLLKLLPVEDPHEALFESYEAALAELSSCGEPQPILRRFELGLLSELGYAQTLTHLTDGSEVLGQRRYSYDFGQGVVPHAVGEAGYSGKTLLDMAAGSFEDPRTLSESKQLMRVLINHYLADKPLLTRQLLVDLQTL